MVNVKEQSSNRSPGEGVGDGQGMVEGPRSNPTRKAIDT